MTAMLRLEHTPVPFQIAALLVVMAVHLASNALAYADLPRPVRATLEAKFGDARCARGERHTTGGRAVHEVTLCRAGRDLDVSVTPDGEVGEVEAELGGRELPPAVSEDLAARHPGGRAVSAYEVRGATGGREVRARYDPAGRLVRESVE